MNSRGNWQKHLDFMFIDFVSLLVSFTIAYLLRHSSFNSFNNEYWLFLGLIVIVNLLVFFFYNPFSKVLKRGYLIELESTLLNCLINLAIVVLVLFISKTSEIYSRTTISLTYIFYFVLSYISRITYKKVLQSRGRNELSRHSKSLFIICKEKDAEKLIENLNNVNNMFYYISGLCIIDKNLKGKSVNKNKVVASSSNLLDYISKNRVDEIFIGLNIDSVPKKILEGINTARIPLHIVVDSLSSLDNSNQKLESFGNYNVISTVTNNITSSQLFIKRIIDIVGGLIGCVITLLLIIIIGPIIYIKSPGNIFYVSDRVGRNGRTFKFYKFRSMVLNADDLKKDLAKKNRLKDGMMFKVDNDPRIIKGIGEFIRKTSLDEFPQFFNVLKGDMSLVGTRPPTIDEWEKYSPYYRSRLSIKPGITGLWQISGRSNITDFNEVVRLDNEYIDNFSISLDIKILFKTIGAIFNKDNNGAL